MKYCSISNMIIITFLSLVWLSTVSILSPRKFDISTINQLSIDLLHISSCVGTLTNTLTLYCSSVVVWCVGTDNCYHWCLYKYPPAATRHTTLTVKSVNIYRWCWSVLQYHYETVCGYRLSTFSFLYLEITHWTLIWY